MNPDILQNQINRDAQLARIALLRKQYAGELVDGVPVRFRFNAFKQLWSYSFKLDTSNVPVVGVGFESKDAAIEDVRAFLAGRTSAINTRSIERQVQAMRSLSEAERLALYGKQPDALPVVRLYTDGSNLGQPGPGGWGALLVWPDGRDQELSGPMRSVTNNQAELTAVIEGLRALTEPCAVTLVSDSQYVVQGLNTWLDGWVKRGWRGQSGDVKNRDLWEQLLALKQKHQITANWVRGHNGHPENERVDQLAGQESRAEKARQEAAVIQGYRLEPKNPPTPAQALKPAKPVPAASEQDSSSLKPCDKCRRKAKVRKLGSHDGRYCPDCYDELLEQLKATANRKELRYSR